MGPQTAVITGASRGLGLALAVALTRRGWTVIADARGAAALEAARRSIPGLSAVPGDIRSAEHRAALADAVSSTGRCDLLVNNASSLGPTPLPALVDLPPGELSALFEVNVAAPLALVQTLVPFLDPEAAVVNITSDAAVEGYPGWGGYGASKAALDQVSNVLAAELPELRIYAFDPGDMRTVMHRDAFPGEDISDRPLPETTAVPALLRLLEGRPRSGRYRALDLMATATA
jgi:NAD(P)-dependent dehydrogenase (short-subunit alcohol dehydrogenase family)